MFNLAPGPHNPRAIFLPGAASAMIDHLDHLVLTTIDPLAAEDFYVRVLGMQLDTFAGGRKAFTYGNQKINLHVRGQEFEPKAHLPVPGALDLCFIASVPLEQVIAHLQQVNWPIIEGPVPRTGATGPIRSVYLRDPDLNLIEISERL
jgi:catechol 2,3-dioxygenase-like lactoylglutathione lyase family enzyme